MKQLKQNINEIISSFLIGMAIGTFIVGIIMKSELAYLIGILFLILQQLVSLNSKLKGK